MVLGGVHGNESASLLVVPRANRLSTYEFERTRSGFGDRNRLYPGYAESLLPMARMAAEITFAAQQFEVDLLLDLHESWDFFAEHDERGTAFLGQTVRKGDGPFELAEVAAIAGGVNEQASTREQLLLRDRRSFGGGGGSSLSLGRHVPGLTPLLIEMGQQNQPEWRRAELHQLFVRSTLERWARL
jgi:hypothetical protein